MKRYTRIPHLPGSRLGPSDRVADAGFVARCTGAGRSGDRVIVSEKLDGSCVAIIGTLRRSFLPERPGVGTLQRPGVSTTSGVVAYGRDGVPCAESRNDGRRAFATWVSARAARLGDVLAPGEWLVCEWLVLAHGTRYALPHGPAVAIDGFAADGTRWLLDEVRRRASAAGLPVAHIVHDGPAITIDVALAGLGERGQHGALEPAEGLVYRVERAGKVVGLAKYVRPGKHDGCYLADHTGGDHVWNLWQDDPP